MSTYFSTEYGEDSLVEQPAIALLAELGWQTVACFHEFDRAGRSVLGRESRGEVVLVERLRTALATLNPDLPPSGLDQAVEALTRDRRALSAVEANREVYTLLREGVKVRVPDPHGDGEITQTARVIDWDAPGNNDFLLASQLWVSDTYYTRRPDLVGFVNGLPLLLLELKAPGVDVQRAYDDNLCDYKDTIPPLFWYNALILLSNGTESKVGSLTAGWEHFADWKKIEREDEPETVSLETVLRGVCAPQRLLDLVAHFTLFQERTGGAAKLVAKNHQYLGVNNAITAVRSLEQNRGKLGVFWHTQGSGKSISMIFFAQKILRTLPGAWTFVIVTDRETLDEQIYKNFVRCGVVSEEEARAASGADLQQLLRENHRYVFTLIQKFHTRSGEQYPVLSERENIIVIADEAHRSQYDTFARNMRRALPNAAFIAFTGTPLIAGEELTRQIFGDYVSVYNFRQSVEDGATVPLYYENRVPQVQLTNDQLNADLECVLDVADADEEQVVELERRFGREYDIITRDNRLETIAADIVQHFMQRGYRGKAMVVSIDKVTAVRMYDKVQRHWQARLEELRAELLRAGPTQWARLQDDIRYMEETDMAVVVSPEQNEIAKMARKGVDIRPHRRRMNEEDLDEKFKDPDDLFRLVFVCAKWMTGFDVPTCSTIYLDKPMRNHTLMQTIARANRVAQGKVHGLIVDYYGIFRHLEQALAIYAAPSPEDEEGAPTIDRPVDGKEALVADLRAALTEVQTFCAEHGVHLNAIRQAPTANFARAQALADAADRLLVNEQTTKRFLALARAAIKLYKAILPDPAADDLEPLVALLRALVRQVQRADPTLPLDSVVDAVDALLDESIVALEYVIPDASHTITPDGPLVLHEGRAVYDLSRIDFDALQARFAAGHKHTAAAQLRGQIAEQLEGMVRRNRTRVDFQGRFQQLVEEYNAGSRNVESLFEELLRFAATLDEEEQRSIAEHLSEEDLAIFDLLTKPHMDLTEKERRQVKTAAQELLKTLKNEKLVLDWRNRQQSRAAVHLCIEDVLDRHLPAKYDEQLFDQKCRAVFQHVAESYFGGGHSVYQHAA